MAGRRDRVVAAVVAVAVLALAARLAFLDARVAHWDEARVGWWTLEYVETGTWEYRPIVHGPFLFQVNRLVFALLGPGDAAGRLVVAVLGGLLPLSALLFRGPPDGTAPLALGDDETVALAVVLAADPILLFYSRFMRSDLPVAAFAFWTFALLVAARRTGRRRYALAAPVAMALALAAKENALLYVLCWIGAALLVGFRTARAGAPWRDVVGHARAAVGVPLRQSGAAAAAVARSPGTTLLALGELLAVVVLFYAPRGGEGTTLGAAFADPSLWPAVVVEATLGSARTLLDVWLFAGYQDPSPRYFAILVVLALVGSLSTVGFAAVGLSRERASPRPLVSFAAAWAALSVAGYPVASDIVAGWTAVHVVVPLSVPAAVGLAALVRRARPLPTATGTPSHAGSGDGEVAAARLSLRRLPAGFPLQRLRARHSLEGLRGTPAVVSERPGATRALVLVGVLGAHAVLVGGLTSYVAPGHQENVLAQPAQGDDRMRPTVRAAVAVARDSEGVDVAYYGPYFEFHVLRRLPLAWYFRAADHGATGPERVRTTTVVAREALLADPPPVVVAPSYQAGDLARLEGYACFAHELEYWSDREPGGPTTKTRVYVDRGALEAYGSTLSSQHCGSRSSPAVGSASGSASTASAAPNPRASTTATRN